MTNAYTAAILGFAISYFVVKVVSLSIDMNETQQ